VWLGNSAEVIATTDAQGKYSVADPAKWTNAPVVFHPDYALAEDFYYAQKKASADLQIDAGVPVTGRVVGSDGNTPAAGATPTINSFALATSAADGTFTIAHAPKQWETIEAHSGDLFAI